MYQSQYYSENLDKSRLECRAAFNVFRLKIILASVRKQKQAQTFFRKRFTRYILQVILLHGKRLIVWQAVYSVNSLRFFSIMSSILAI